MGCIVYKLRAYRFRHVQYVVGKGEQVDLEEIMREILYDMLSRRIVE